MINIRKIVLLSALLMSASSITAPTYAMDDNEQGVSASRVTHAKVPYKLTPDMIQDIRQQGSFLVPTKSILHTRYGASFIIREFVLQNPDQLDIFEGYLNSARYSTGYGRPHDDYEWPLDQRSRWDDGGLYYYDIYNASMREHNLNYDPKRPEGTGPEWIPYGCITKFSTLIFKEQECVFAGKPTAVVRKHGHAWIFGEQEIGSIAASSAQASSSVNPVNEVSIRSEEEVVEKPVAATRFKPEEELEGPVVASSMQVPMSVDPSHEIDPETAIKSLIERHGDDRLALANALTELWGINLK